MLMVLLMALFTPLYVYLMITSWLITKRSKYHITEWLFGAVPLTLLLILLVYRINC